MTKDEGAQIAALAAQMDEWQRYQQDQDQRLEKRFDRLDENIACLERRTRSLENISKFQGGVFRTILWILGFGAAIGGAVAALLRVFGGKG